mgnify:CR=1 FL=1
MKYKIVYLENGKTKTKYFKNIESCFPAFNTSVKAEIFEIFKIKGDERQRFVKG